MGLTFDEAALLLDLRDVYWTRQGLLSVQLSLGATAILSIAILTLRMLRRGERRREAEGLIPPAPTDLIDPRRLGQRKGGQWPPFLPLFVLKDLCLLALRSAGADECADQLRPIREDRRGLGIKMAIRAVGE